MRGGKRAACREDIGNTFGSIHRSFVKPAGELRRNHLHRYFFEARIIGLRFALQNPRNDPLSIGSEQIVIDLQFLRGDGLLGPDQS